MPRIPIVGMHRYRYQHRILGLILCLHIRTYKSFLIQLHPTPLYGSVTSTGINHSAEQVGSKMRVPAMSALWRFFKINDSDKSKADCKLCTAKLSRGGATTSSYNTSILIKHLKSQHDAQFSEFANASSGKPQQPTLRQALEKQEKMLSYPVHCS